MKIQISNYEDYRLYKEALEDKEYSDEGVKNPELENDRQGEGEEIESNSTYAGPVPSIYR
jgi:hypothetical protein